MVGQRDGCAGTRPRRRQLQHQGEPVGCRWQCGDYGEPGDHGGRDAPTIAITSPVAGDNIINKSEAAAGVTISGTAAAGTGGAAVNGQTATITIVDGSNAVKDTYTTTVTAGAWSVNVTAAQAQGLADGSYSIKANLSDAAGNAATTASQAITVDETSPTIAITSPVAGDNIINKTEAAAGVTISGTASAGTGGAAVNGQTATITIVDGSNAVKDTYTATVTAGAWSVNVTALQAQALADGSYSIKANVSDAAGNAATTASQTITVDETSPTIAITSPVAGDNIINKTEAAAGVTISGTATAGSAGVNGQTATITILDSSNAVKETYTATVTAGAWSVNVTAAQAQGLADGSYSIKANVSDAAGNAATTASQAVAVDETAPSGGAPISGTGVRLRNLAYGRHHQRDGADLHGGTQFDGCGGRYGPTPSRRFGARASGDAYYHRSRCDGRRRQPDGDRRRPRGRWLEVDHGPVHRCGRQQLDHFGAGRYAGHHGAGEACAGGGCSGDQRRCQCGERHSKPGADRDGRGRQHCYRLR